MFGGKAKQQVNSGKQEECADNHFAYAEGFFGEERLHIVIVEDKGHPFKDVQKHKKYNGCFVQVKKSGLHTANMHERS